MPEIKDTPIRELLKNLIVQVNSLEKATLRNPELKKAYNSFCDILDQLNNELRDEDQGLIPCTWSKLSLEQEDENCS